MGKGLCARPVPAVAPRVLSAGGRLKRPARRPRIHLRPTNRVAKVMLPNYSRFLRLLLLMRMR